MPYDKDNIWVIIEKAPTPTPAPAPVASAPASAPVASAQKPKPTAAQKPKPTAAQPKPAQKPIPAQPKPPASPASPASPAASPAQPKLKTAAPAASPVTPASAAASAVTPASSGSSGSQNITFVLKHPNIGSDKISPITIDTLHDTICLSYDGPKIQSLEDDILETIIIKDDVLKPNFTPSTSNLDVLARRKTYELESYVVDVFSGKYQIPGLNNVFDSAKTRSLDTCKTAMDIKSDFNEVDPFSINFHCDLLLHYYFFNEFPSIPLLDKNNDKIATLFFREVLRDVYVALIADKTIQIVSKQAKYIDALKILHTLKFTCSYGKALKLYISTEIPPKSIPDIPGYYTDINYDETTLLSLAVPLSISKSGTDVEWTVSQSALANKIKKISEYVNLKSVEPRGDPASSGKANDTCIHRLYIYSQKFTTDNEVSANMLSLCKYLGDTSHLTMVRIINQARLRAKTLTLSPLSLPPESNFYNKLKHDDYKIKLQISERIMIVRSIKEYSDYQNILDILVILISTNASKKLLPWIKGNIKSFSSDGIDINLKEEEDESKPFIEYCTNQKYLFQTIISSYLQTMDDLKEMLDQEPDILLFIQTLVDPNKNKPEKDITVLNANDDNRKTLNELLNYYQIILFKANIIHEIRAFLFDIKSVKDYENGIMNELKRTTEPIVKLMKKNNPLEPAKIASTLGLYKPGNRLKFNRNMKGVENIHNADNNPNIIKEYIYILKFLNFSDKILQHNKQVDEFAESADKINPPDPILKEKIIQLKIIDELKTIKLDKNELDKNKEILKEFVKIDVDLAEELKNKNKQIVVYFPQENGWYDGKVLDNDKAGRNKIQYNATDILWQHLFGLDDDDTRFYPTLYLTPPQTNDVMDWFDVSDVVDKTNTDLLTVLIDKRNKEALAKLANSYAENTELAAKKELARLTDLVHKAPNAATKAVNAATKAVNAASTLGAAKVANAEKELEKATKASTDAQTKIPEATDALTKAAEELAKTMENLEEATTAATEANNAIDIFAKDAAKKHNDETKIKRDPLRLEKQTEIEQTYQGLAVDTNKVKTLFEKISDDFNELFQDNGFTTNSQTISTAISDIKLIIAEIDNLPLTPLTPPIPPPKSPIATFTLDEKKQFQQFLLFIEILDLILKNEPPDLNKQLKIVPLKKNLIINSQSNNDMVNADVTSKQSWLQVIIDSVSSFFKIGQDPLLGGSNRKNRQKIYTQKKSTRRFKTKTLKAYKYRQKGGVLRNVEAELKTIFNRFSVDEALIAKLDFLLTLPEISRLKTYIKEIADKTITDDEFKQLLTDKLKEYKIDIPSDLLYNTLSTNKTLLLYSLLDPDIKQEISTNKAILSDIIESTPTPSDDITHEMLEYIKVMQDHKLDDVQISLATFLYKNNLITKANFVSNLDLIKILSENIDRFFSYLSNDFNLYFDFNMSELYKKLIDTAESAEYKYNSLDKNTQELMYYIFIFNYITANTTFLDTFDAQIVLKFYTILRRSATFDENDLSIIFNLLKEIYIQKTKQFNISEDIKIELAQMEAKVEELDKDQVEELDKANPPFREFNTDYIDTLFYDLPVQTASTTEPLNPSTGGKLTKKTRKNKKE